MDNAILDFFLKIHPSGIELCCHLLPRFLNCLLSMSSSLVFCRSYHFTANDRIVQFQAEMGISNLFAYNLHNGLNFHQYKVWKKLCLSGTLCIVQAPAYSLGLSILILRKFRLQLCSADDSDNHFQKCKYHVLFLYMILGIELRGALSLSYFHSLMPFYFDGF